MALFFCFTSLLNLGLGYALALFLHHDGPLPAFWPAAHHEPEPEPEPAHEAVAQAAPAPPAAPPVTEAPAPAPAPLPEVKGDAQDLHDMADALCEFTIDLTDLDDRLRQCAENITSEALEAQCQRLTEVNQTFLAKQREVAERGTTGWENVLSDHAARVTAVDRQAAQLPLQADPKASAKQLLDQTNQLVDANFKLRDVVEQSLAKAALDGSSSEGATDGRWSQTAVDRIAVETSLAEWWSKDVHNQGNFSLALIDLDDLRRINQEHGPLVGDRILQSLSRDVAAAVKNDERAARFNGPKVLLTLPQTTTRDASKLVERLRQQFEMTTFEHRETAIRVTVSGAVVQAMPSDTPAGILERLDNTLRDVKRYGCNRTFVHDGTYPTPVMPPELDTQQRTIAI